MTENFYIARRRGIVDKSAPSKWASEKARKFYPCVGPACEAGECSGCEKRHELALEFDAIALESERNVCQILRGENSSTAAREPLRISDAMDSYRDAIARERDEVTEKLAKALDFMYRYFVMPGHPERAKDCPNKDCPFCKADEALAAYRERMGR